MGYIQIVSCITGHSGYGSILREERRRNIAASIRGLAPVEKQELEGGGRGEEVWMGVGEVPRTFKRAVRGG